MQLAVLSARGLPARVIPVAPQPAPALMGTVLITLPASLGAVPAVLGAIPAVLRALSSLPEAIPVDLRVIPAVLGAVPAVLRVVTAVLRVVIGLLMVLTAVLRAVLVSLGAVPSVKNHCYNHQMRNRKMPFATSSQANVTLAILRIVFPYAKE